MTFGSTGAGVFPRGSSARTLAIPNHATTRQQTATTTLFTVDLLC